MPDGPLAFTRYFAALPDPRVNRTKKHTLHDILGVTFCAVICGADSFEEIARFGNARESWLKRHFPLANGIPSHDTFNRVFAGLDRDQFSACFASWMTNLCRCAGLRAIALDGKAFLPRRPGRHVQRVSAHGQRLNGPEPPVPQPGQRRGGVARDRHYPRGRDDKEAERFNADETPRIARKAFKR